MSAGNRESFKAPQCRVENTVLKQGAENLSGAFTNPLQPPSREDDAGEKQKRSACQKPTNRVAKNCKQAGRERSSLRIDGSAAMSPAFFIDEVRKIPIRSLRSKLSKNVLRLSLGAETRMTRNKRPPRSIPTYLHQTLCGGDGEREEALCPGPRDRERTSVKDHQERRVKPPGLCRQYAAKGMPFGLKNEGSTTRCKTS